MVDGDGSAYAAGVLRLLADAVQELVIVTSFETLVPQVGPGYDRAITLEQLFGACEVRRHIASSVELSDDGRLTVRDNLNGAVVKLDGLDAVVALEPRVSVVAGEAPDRATVIGDALSPRNLDAAISDGATAGLLSQPV